MLENASNFFPSFLLPFSWLIHQIVSQKQNLKLRTRGSHAEKCTWFLFTTSRESHNGISQHSHRRGLLSYLVDYTNMNTVCHPAVNSTHPVKIPLYFVTSPVCFVFEIARAQKHVLLSKSTLSSEKIVNVYRRAFQGHQGNDQGAWRQSPSLPP